VAAKLGLAGEGDLFRTTGSGDLSREKDRARAGAGASTTLSLLEGRAKGLDGRSLAS